jgi:hypothetical protein
MAVGKVAWVVAAVVLLFAKLVNATVVEDTALEVVEVLVKFTGNIFPSRMSWLSSVAERDIRFLFSPAKLWY